jgi:hypothetical protein
MRRVITNHNDGVINSVLTAQEVRLDDTANVTRQRSTSVKSYRGRSVVVNHSMKRTFAGAAVPLLDRDTVSELLSVLFRRAHFQVVHVSIRTGIV